MLQLQRSYGKVDIKFKNDNIVKFFQKGSSKALIPNTHNDYKQIVLINTAGGITGGDKFCIGLELDNSKICGSTQAAEKIYKGDIKEGKIDLDINLKNNSTLFWLPKEMILFNNCNLKRQINVNLSTNSNLLMSESTIFGRTAMKETFSNGNYKDFWKIFIGKKLIHVEATKSEGNIEEFLSKAATFNNNCAINITIGIGKRILENADKIKNNLLKNNEIISEMSIWDEKLVIRTISQDSYHLGFAIKKILFYFFNGNIPKVWSL